MFPNIPFDRVNWFTSSFLVVTLLTALIGTPIYFAHYGFDPVIIGMFFVLSLIHI